jgi:hypothetical protein
LTERHKTGIIETGEMKFWRDVHKEGSNKICSNPVGTEHFNTKYYNFEIQITLGISHATNGR